MINNKITLSLWFHSDDGKMEQVTTYYATIFKDNFRSYTPTSLGETPGGYAEMCKIELFDNPYVFMTTAALHHPFNDAFAIIIHCQNQEEIDHYWNYFTKDGKESMCGWCNDKFGLRWQIIPDNFEEIMKNPNAAQVMYTQSKIVIADYF
jgi:predicted 3-demethylubiquinone-9 3-methyltransferase (glyoxalase superfamily)